jgi:hypothetical protein
LFVGGSSKDPDARWGYGAGIHAKGYKLHTIWAAGCLPDAGDVTSLHRSESVVAEELLTPACRGGYLLADGNYDVDRLHEAAGQRGTQLLAKDRRPNAGKGHRPVGAYRRRGIELRNTPFGKELLQHRVAVERTYGQITSFGGGLAPLPAWVRRQCRVRTWVWSKLLINAVRIQRNQQLAT